MKARAKRVRVRKVLHSPHEEENPATSQAQSPSSQETPTTIAHNPQTYKTTIKPTFHLTIHYEI